MGADGRDPWAPAEPVSDSAALSRPCVLPRFSSPSTHSMGSGSTAARFYSAVRSGPTSSITLCRPPPGAERAKGFLTAVPDLRVAVVQRLVVDDRVISHLRFTGHFTGTFMGHAGAGQPVDFIATDILRVRDGRITDNWHLEDNLTFLQQIGMVISR